MKILLGAVAGITLLAGASAASAAENYGTIGYSKVDLADVDLGAVTARIGTNINQWFGIEGELSLGVDDASATDSSGTYTLKLKNEVGAFAVARAPLGEGFTVFGRVGYASTKFEATGPGISGEGSTDGVAYGAGAQYDFGANGVRFDYTRYDVEIDDADTYAISYVRKF